MAALKDFISRNLGWKWLVQIPRAAIIERRGLGGKIFPATDMLNIREEMA